MYMLHEVTKVLDENRPIWEGETRMVSLVEEYKIKLARLEDLLVIKGELETPYTEVRNVLLDEFATKIVQLAGFLHELSIENGSKNMTIYTDISKSALINASIQDCLTKSKAVIDYAASMQEELGTYSNGLSLLSEATEQYQSFRDNGLLPFDRRNRLRNLNKDIRNLITEIREYLTERLDRVVLFFTDSEPGFFEKFKEARVIPKLNATRKSGGAESEEDIEDEDLPDHEGEESDDASETGVDSTDTESPPVEEDGTDTNDGSTEDDSSDDETDLV